MFAIVTCAMRIKFRYKLLLALTTLTFLVLLVQGILSGSMVLEMLEKRTVASLTREAAGKTQILSHILRESEEDLTILAAHRDNENFFTFRSFQENDGMVDALSGLELFFLRVHEVKPRYDRIQLLTSNGGGPVLQINDGKTVHQYDNFDPENQLRDLASKEKRAVHHVDRGAEGQMDLLSLKALQINGQVEGYLVLRQSIRELVQTMLAELGKAGITAVLCNQQGVRVVATPDYQPRLEPLFRQASSSGEWITVLASIPVLDWSLAVGMPRSESFTLFRNQFIAGLISAVFLVAVMLYFVRKAIQTLKAYNRILEQQVSERTAQLERANEEIRQLNESLKQENLRLGAELMVARQIQQMVLPRQTELLIHDHLDMAAFMEPASEVGGDYYDILQGEDGRLLIGIGDVTGHGLESGVLMLMTQSMVRILFSFPEIEVGMRLELFNRALFANINRMASDKNLTLVLVDYTPGISSDGEYSGAGAGLSPGKDQTEYSPAGHLRISGQHESLLVVRQAGDLTVVDTQELGFPIGLVDNILPYVNATTLTLDRGDVVILYTDGITEAANLHQELYGLERLCQVAVRNRHLEAEEIKEAVVADVKRHVGAQTIYDDLTLVILKQK
ncbi:MAG: SpoIIE family protein phosphatase [Magnetococcus sp. DMHC-1]|nr:SpoIIE family protein phosphatase [Magnetococcales bacterium]